MKKNIIIISIGILLVLFTMFGVIYCNEFLSGRQEDKNNIENLEPKKVLENYERVKSDGSLEREEELSSFVTEENIEISESSKALLEYFGKDMAGKKTVKKIYNKNFCMTVTRVITDNMEVDFDENGDIVKYENLDDFHTGDKDKKDYVEGEKLPEVEYEIDSEEKIQGIISKLEELSNLEGYKLWECSNNIQGTWLLSWSREYDGGLINYDDDCSAVVDAKDGSIWMYGKNVMTPNRIVPAISEASAIEAASSIISRYEGSTVTSVKLSFTRPNFYFEEGGPYERANFVRLCYEISMDNDVVIYIDAETAEVLGGHKWNFKRQ